MKKARIMDEEEGGALPALEVGRKAEGKRAYGQPALHSAATEIYRGEPYQST